MPPCHSAPTRNLFFPPPSHHVHRNIFSWTAPRSFPWLGSVARTLCTNGRSMGEVTADNFEALLPEIEEDIRQCTYIALDAEFTGLHPADGRRDDYYDTTANRYSSMRLAAQSFLIMQYGLCLVRWEAVQKRYTAKTYNFYVFPRPYGDSDHRFLSQASSLAFLRDHNFNFNKFVYHGIPYLSIQQQEKLSRPRPPFTPVNLSRAEDIAFVEAQVESVAAFVSSPASVPPLLLAPANSFLRAAMRQQMEQRFSTSLFFVNSIPAERGAECLQLTRASVEEVAEVEAAKAEEKQGKIREAAGFGLVVKAMVESRKPVVGHNMVLDLAYTWQQFIGPLPWSWEEYRAEVVRAFPGGIFDTKHLARSLPGVFEEGTSLAEVYNRMQGRGEDESGGVLLKLSQDGEPTRVALPVLHHAEGFTRYQHLEAANSMAHEAGYDAYMTAAAFAGLAHCLQARDGEGQIGLPAEVRPLEALAAYAYRLNLMRSDMRYLALQGPAPSPDRSHVFMLSGIAPKATAATIIALFESVGISGPRVMWIDQSTARVELPRCGEVGCYSALSSKLEAAGWQGKCALWDEADLKEAGGGQAKKRGKRKMETNATGVEVAKANRCVVM